MLILSKGTPNDSLCQLVNSFVVFYKNWGFYLNGVWLWRISGGYS